MSQQGDQGVQHQPKLPPGFAQNACSSRGATSSRSEARNTSSSWISAPRMPSVSGLSMLVVSSFLSLRNLPPLMERPGRKELPDTMWEHVCNLLKVGKLQTCRHHSLRRLKGKRIRLHRAGRGG